jgi:hypothetical protein
MSEAPSTNGSNGERAAHGRFAKGNPGGRGNPFARAVARLRAELLRGVKRGDMREVVTALLTKAKTGDVPATKELLTRLLGDAVPMDLLERIERLETLAKDKNDENRNQT